MIINLRSPLIYIIVNWGRQNTTHVIILLIGNLLIHAILVKVNKLRIPSFYHLMMMRWYRHKSLLIVKAMHRSETGVRKMLIFFNLNHLC